VTVLLHQYGQTVVGHYYYPKTQLPTDFWGEVCGAFSSGLATMSSGQLQKELKLQIKLSCLKWIESPKETFRQRFIQRSNFTGSQEGSFLQPIGCAWLKY